MINIKQLTDKDKGRWVRKLNSDVADLNKDIRLSLGRIKDWDSEYIHVVFYHPDRNMDKYESYGAFSIDPEDLVFVDDAWNSIRRIL